MKKLFAYYLITIPTLLAAHGAQAAENGTPTYLWYGGACKVASVHPQPDPDYPVGPFVVTQVFQGSPHWVGQVVRPNAGCLDRQSRIYDGHAQENRQLALAGTLPSTPVAAASAR